MISANCGDSRAIKLRRNASKISWHSNIITKDHKPDVESEV
jgi:serine/threonine protein phosphatase PrpC